MKDLERRLAKLEKIVKPKPTRAKDHLTPLIHAAFSTLSEEVLWELDRIWDKEFPENLTESEETALAAYEAALEAEARRAGFKSLADAKRQRGGKRRANP